MADVAEIQLMKVSGLTNGTDVWKGIKGFRSRTNPNEVYRGRLEGELNPTILEPIETDQPPVQGSFTASSSVYLTVLAGTSHDTITFTAKDIVAGANVTVTLSDVRFLGADGGITNRGVDGFQLAFEASDIGIAPAA